MDLTTKYGHDIGLAEERNDDSFLEEMKYDI
jgi:hypothetical protein